MTTSKEPWEDQPGDALSNQDIHAKLLEHKEAGIISYVLPTDPLGQAWVIGIDGQILTLNGKAQAVAFLYGADSVLNLLARRLGGGSIPATMLAPAPRGVPDTP